MKSRPLEARHTGQAQVPPPRNGRVMPAYKLTHLSDAALLRDLAALVAQDRTTTAALLAHLAEVDNAPVVRAGSPSVDVQLLRPRAAPVGGRSLQTHPGGASGPALPRNLRRGGRRS